MKNILKISIAALASAALLSGCIKETFPTDRATSDQIAGSPSALEAMVKGIPTALIQVKSLTDYGNMHWNFSLPAIHLATDSAAGDMAITGDTGKARHHTGADKPAGGRCLRQKKRQSAAKKTQSPVIQDNDRQRTRLLKKISALYRHYREHRF